MGTVILDVKRVDDATLFRLFSEAMSAGEKAIKAGVKAKSLHESENKLERSFRTGLPWKPTDEELRKAKAGQFVLNHCSIAYSRQTTDARGTVSANITFSYERAQKNGELDQFSINWNDNNGVMQGDAQQAVQKAIHLVLSKILQPVAPEDGGLVPTLSNLAEGFSTTYQNIASELSNAVSAVNAERAALLAAFEDERRILREEVAAERNEMQAKLRKEAEETRANFKAERDELDAKLANLEMSSHKDARRKQFEELKNKLEEGLKSNSVSKEIRILRWGIFGAILFAGTSSGIFAYFSFHEVSGASDAAVISPGSVLSVIRSMILTGISVGSFFAAAAWLRYFITRDMQAREDLLNFRNDMARASWVMDASLEIRKEHSEEIPSEWLSGVTAGLFAGSRKEPIEEGAQAMAALLGLSASASVGPNGTNVEIGKKGARAIARAVNDSD